MVFLQLLISFLLHFIIIGTITFALLQLELVGLLNIPTSIGIFVVVVIVAILFPHGWEYIFSSESEIEIIKRNIKDYIASPTIYQYLITDVIAVVLASIAAYVVFYFKVLTNRWERW